MQLNEVFRKTRCCVFLDDFELTTSKPPAPSDIVTSEPVQTDRNVETLNMAKEARNPDDSENEEPLEPDQPSILERSRRIIKSSELFKDC